MRHLLLCLIFIFGLISGCAPNSRRSSSVDDGAKKDVQVSTKDDITWLEKRIKHEDVSIDLGYQDGYAGGRWIQPVTVIRRGATPVANAMVFNRLMSADENKAAGEEFPTAYQSSADVGDAKYVGSKLRLPRGDSECVVNFRIVLPDRPEPWTRDVTIQVE